MRKERKILRFVPQKLRKSFANGRFIRATTVEIKLVMEPIWKLMIFLENADLSFISYRVRSVHNVHNFRKFLKAKINGLSKAAFDELNLIF